MVRSLVLNGGVVVAMIFTIATAGPHATAQARQQSNADFAGDWSLRVEPSARRGFSVTVRPRNGQGASTIQMAVRIEQTPTGYRCSVDQGRTPARCERRGEELIIRAGALADGVMTFAVARTSDRRAEGEASLSAPGLPGSSVGIGRAIMERQ